MKVRIIVFLILISLPYFVFSAGMDANYKFAWSDTLGWVNFNPTYGNVQVFNDKLTGYAWSENYGWINLSPTNSGIRNDGNGNLSGYAWGENVGWIDFSNVKINPNTGEFSGYAIILGGPGGIINFDCNNCKVVTQWRKIVETRKEEGFQITGRTYQKPPEEINLEPYLLPLLNALQNLFGRREISEKPTEEIYFPEEFIKPGIRITKPPEAITPQPEIVSELQPVLYLPEPLKTLAERIEKFRKKLIETGITKTSDLARFKGLILTIPTISEIFDIAKTVPFAKIFTSYKDKVPYDVLIVTSKALDLPIKIKIEKEDKIILNLNTKVDEELNFIYKPSRPVKNIRGQLILKEKRSIGLIDFIKKQFGNILVSLNFIKKQEGFIIKEFYYDDKDRDGIYISSLTIPKIPGTYEVKTLVSYYEEPPKEISLITYADPSGYVYEKIWGREVRIERALVYLYWLNPEHQKIELWPAKDYYQENPQITNKSGEYSFIVPPGRYFIKVEKEGYYPYQSSIFEIKENDYLGMPIELKSKMPFISLNIIQLAIIVAGIIILILVLILLRSLKRSLRKS